MVELYVAARELIRRGMKLQSSYDNQLLEELRWRVEREQEAQAAEQKARRKAKLKQIRSKKRYKQSRQVKPGALVTISSTGKTFGALIRGRFATCAIQGIICRTAQLLESRTPMRDLTTRNPTKCDQR